MRNLPWLYYFILAAVLIGAIYITLFNLPGLWAMVFATFIYALITHFQHAGLKTLIAIFVMAAIAELFDLVAASAGAKKAGANKRGLWGAIIGGILGGIFLAVAIPVIGIIIGICIGTFAGAVIGELLGDTDVTKSVWIGIGATFGRLLGILTKLFFGCTILATVLLTALPPLPPFPHLVNFRSWIPSRKPTTMPTVGY
jgi:uncharacterized protein YqgC (DUF456 family)